MRNAPYQNFSSHVGLCVRASKPIWGTNTEFSLFARVTKLEEKKRSYLRHFCVRFFAPLSALTESLRGEMERVFLTCAFAWAEEKKKSLQCIFFFSVRPPVGLCVF